jgi:hypothetical protein
MFYDLFIHADTFAIVTSVSIDQKLISFNLVVALANVQRSWLSSAFARQQLRQHGDVFAAL